MSQGYGNNDQQPQWDQRSQWDQQQPQQQWSQVSPGQQRSPQLAKLANWLFYGVIAVIAVRFLLGVVAFGVGFVSGAVGAGESSGGVLAAAGVGLLGLLVNGLVSVAVLVLAIMVIVQASGRGRTGAIIVVAALVLAVVAYWLLQIIYSVALAGADFSAIGVISILALVAEIIRSLLVFAALLVGAIMVRRWVAQNA